MTNSFLDFPINDWRRYYPILDIPEGESGNTRIVHRTFSAGWKTPLSSTRTAILANHKEPEIRFPIDTRWHVLQESDVTWMVDIPIEQFQQTQVIQDFHGDVLVGGLGVGFIATVLCKMPSVKSVIVAESNPDVIKLVAPYLLKDDPEAKKKLLVAKYDLFRFLGDTTMTFDCGFYDIWIEDNQSTFLTKVVPLRKLSQGKVSKITCWNEDVMRGQLLVSLESRKSSLKFPDSGMTIERLCTPLNTGTVGDIWINWSVPFFQWVKENNMLEVSELFGTAAEHYARLYGIHDNWLKEWKKVMGG